MDNSFTLVKKGFTAAIAAATILWAVGVAAFAVPTTAHAASGGDLIKGTSLSTVYYMGYDGNRYTFVNEKTYDTWFNGFDMVTTISDAELAAINLGGNVVYRPGSRWIKIVSDAKTYAVATNGMIHHIESEAIATDYAGSDWALNIDDVPDAFFVDYSVGSSLMSATAFDGMTYMDGGNYMLAWGGESRLVSAAGRSANYMEDRFFLDGAGIDASSLTSGSDLTGFECAVTDAAQTGCVDAGTLTGDISVSLSATTAVGDTLPGGATSVRTASFDLKAGSEDASVNIVKLTLGGVGATTNISNVYLYEGNVRLTDARSVNASTRTATFGSLGLDIPAGTTRTITVRVDAAASPGAGDTFNMQIKSAADITTDGGSVTGTFPSKGNTFTFANQAVGGITITKNGTITNPGLGAQDAVIAQFKATPSGEDANIEELTLKIDDADDHADFKLWNDGVLVATGTYIGDKLVAFDLGAGVEILDGQNEVFKVTADIGGDASDAIKGYLNNSADLLATGGDFGYGLTVTRTGYDGDSCTSTAGDCSYSTVQGGDVTIVFNGPATGDIRVNSQDQVLYDFSITAAQMITVKDLDFIVYGEDTGTDDDDPFDGTDDSGDDDKGLINTNGEGNISDLKLIDVSTGTVVMGPLELDCVTTTCGADGTNDSTQTIDFTDDFEMVAGETLNLRLTADVDNNVTSGTDFGATIDISGFVAEDENGDTLTNATDVVPSTDLQGFGQEANAASMTVSLASTPGDVTVVQGKTGEEVNAFNVVTGDAGEVNVSNITLSVYAHDASTGTFQLGDCSSADQCATRDVDVNDNILSCSIYDLAGNLLDGPTSPQADGTNIIFDDVNWTVPASKVERLSVKCNIGNPSETNDVYLAFDIADLSEDIVAEDEEGTDVDPTTDAPNGGTSPTNVLTVTASGTIAATVDASSPSADFVTTGSNDNLLAVFRLTATNEDFSVNKLSVTEEAAEDKTGVSTSSAYTNNVSALTLEYVDSSGSTVTSAGSFSGNEATFTGLDLFVEYGDPALVNVYVDVPATDRSGGTSTSNEYLELGLSPTAGDFNAVGVDSGVTDTAANDIETNKTFVVKETKPTISVNGSTPSGSGFVPGDQEVFRFDVGAHANEDVIIDEMVFAMASTDNTGTPTEWNQCDNAAANMAAADFDMYNLSTDGLSDTVEVDADVTMLAADGATCDTTADTNAGEDVEYWLIDLTTPETIPAGTTYTFAVYIDSTGASSANDDSIQMSIPADPFLASASFVAASDINNGNLAVTDTVITVTSGTAYSAGDIVCLDVADDNCGSADEKALVVSKSTNDLTIVRGYLGTTPATLTDADDIDRLPSTFYWQDDGDNGTDNTGDNWGSYLVDNLPISGGAMQF